MNKLLIATIIITWALNDDLLDLSLALLLLTSLERQIFLLVGRRSILRSDVYVYLMSIDLPQYLVGVVVERSTWWSTVTMCPYLSIGRTHNLLHNIRLCHLSESKFIDFSTSTLKQEYILLALPWGSILKEFNFFITREQCSSYSLLVPSWSKQMSDHRAWPSLCSAHDWTPLCKSL